MNIRKIIKKMMFSGVFRTPSAAPSWREAIYKKYSLEQNPDSFSIDLGSGPAPRNSFMCKRNFGLDILSGENVIFADLFAGRFPIDDASVDVFTAYDFLEHVPRVFPKLSPEGGVRFPFVELMSEIHRCLRPGGLFFSSTPCFPWPNAFQDPTHVNFMTEETLKSYFCWPNPGADRYGFKGGFNWKEASWIDQHHNVLLQR